MKFLVLAACLSVSAAQYGLVAHPNGAVVPVDEPAVAAARADHFAAGGGHGGLYAGAGYAGVGYAATAPIGHAVGYAGIGGPAYAPAGLGYAAGYGYSGSLNLNTHLVGHPNGAVVPVDEPAVAAARADHFAAKGAITAEHYGTYAAAPIAVAAPVYASVAPTYAAVAAPVFHGYSGPLNLNTHLVAHPNGAVVPVDEPAVAAARADHFAAGGGLGGLYAGHPVAYGAAYGAGYGYGQYGLVAHPNGAVVPVDEPAVQAARADHFAAKAAFGY